MIFISLGSQKFQFNRLLQRVDELVASGVITDEVFAQVGYSDYKPQHYAFEPFLDQAAFSDAMNRADIIITHGGTGAILGGIKKGKKVIAVPRLSRFGEHVDDHQLQIVAEFTNQNFILSCEDMDTLADKLAQLKDHKFNAFRSNTQAYLDAIDAFIQSI